MPSTVRLVYRALLRVLLPRPVRYEVGAEMEDVLAFAIAEQRRRHGRWAAAVGLGRALVDLAGFAVTARRAEWNREALDALRSGQRMEGRVSRFAWAISKLRQDAQFAVRLLLKDRSFTVTALLTLAICIGANAAMFSIVRSVVLKPLPVPHADRIVAFRNEYPNAGVTRGATSVPDYFDRQTETSAFEIQALYRREGVTLGGQDGARRLTVVRATPSFYRLVSAAPLHGRVFAERENRPEGDNEAILSHALWQREFGSAADIVGRDVRLNGTPFRIVGVMPADFRFLWTDVDVYTPASFSPPDRADSQRHSNGWEMIALMKAGVTVERAQEEINALNRRNHDRFPQFRQILTDAGFHTTVVRLQDEVIASVRPMLFLLWGGVLCVLLIGCLNIANLALVRASGRTREMATRQAIGADRGRLARQLLTETTLLSVAGGAAGLALGWWLLRLVPVLNLDEMPRGDEIALDPASAAVVAGATIVIGMLIGMVPVARFWRMNVNAALREEGRSGTASRGTHLVRRSLATAQIAIAFLLLIGAGLLLTSFREVLRINLGFSAAGLVTGAVSLPGTTYRGNAVVPFVNRMLDEIRALPGVEAAGLTTNVPLSGNPSDSVLIPEGRIAKPGESVVSPLQITVSDGYFEAMKIDLVQGRLFDRHDTSSSPPSIIVDERVADQFWPGQDSLGRRVYNPNSPEEVVRPGPNTRWLTVVGVVTSVRMEGLASSRPSAGAYYFAFGQSSQSSFTLAVRSSLGSDATGAAVRSTIARLDPALPFYAVQTMADYYDDALMLQRVPMLIAVAFGGVALFLSALGIYGVLAYGVAERRREIGIRLALGSTAGEVFRLVLRDGLKIVLIGLTLGLGGLVALRRLLAAVLYGVQPTDAGVIAVVAVGLSAVALLAVAIPARRAARVNPAVALAD